MPQFNHREVHEILVEGDCTVIPPLSNLSFGKFHISGWVRVEDGGTNLTRNSAAEYVCTGRDVVSYL